MLWKEELKALGVICIFIAYIWWMLWVSNSAYGGLDLVLGWIRGML